MTTINLLNGIFGFEKHFVKKLGAFYVWFYIKSIIKKSICIHFNYIQKAGKWNIVIKNQIFMKYLKAGNTGNNQEKNK